MTQIIAIHGGTTYADYNEYLSDLATKTLYPERFTFKPKWKDRLQEKLGDEYQVLLPSMPNSTNAKYSEWAIWFKHLEDIIEDDCILIGHSLGAIFLAKYLSENTFSRSIKATILVAAPYDDEETEDLTDFKLKAISDRFTSQAGKVILFFGNDDPVISSKEIKKYQRALPNGEFHVLSAPDHFVREEFSELTDIIAAL